jgi:guanylate cyclase
MVAWLNELYSAFDGFVEARGVEKIRTIGDNYMVAAGVPEPRQDHAVALTDLALDIRDYIAAAPSVRGHRIDFRIGIHSGPVVGGVIGTHKFQYDLWGDAVNTASRMESHGVAGKIQISRATFELVRDHFECEARGAVAMKGKGELETWFVQRRAEPAPT